MKIDFIFFLCFNFSFSFFYPSTLLFYNTMNIFHVFFLIFKFKKNYIKYKFLEVYIEKIIIFYLKKIKLILKGIK